MSHCVLVPVFWQTVEAGFNETEAYLCLVSVKRVGFKKEKGAYFSYTKYFKSGLLQQLRSPIMSNKISKKRSAAFKKQSGKCYYCGSPMWEKNPKDFAKKHNITKKYAGRFRCTAEHLMARCDGGKHQESNIVAACIFCNYNRHQRKKTLGPSKYKAHIHKRLQQGKWHPKKLQNLQPRPMNSLLVS